MAASPNWIRSLWSGPPGPLPAQALGRGPGPVGPSAGGSPPGVELSAPLQHTDRIQSSEATTAVDPEEGSLLTVRLVPPAGTPDGWAAPLVGTPLRLTQDAGDVRTRRDRVAPLRADGTAAFAGLGAARWRLVPDGANGWAPYSVGPHVLPPRARCALSEGERVVFEVPVVEGRSVAGRVVDPGGRPVAGAQVEVADHVPRGVALRWHRVRGATDGAGRFRIEGVHPGADVLDVEAEGFAPARLQGAALRSALAEGAPLEVALTRLETLTVRVVGPDGAPARHGQVFVSGEVGELDRESSIDDAGLATFELPARPARLRVVVLGHGAGPGQRTVPTHGEAELHWTGACEVECALRPWPEVRGRVVGAGARVVGLDVDGGVGGGGEGLARWARMLGGLEVDGLTGAVSGRLLPGEYVVTARRSVPSGEVRASRSLPSRVRVTPEGASFDVRFGGEADLVGRVLLPDGTPAVGLVPRVSGTSLGERHRIDAAATDAEGVFRARCPAPGEYWVSLEGEEHFVPGVSVELPDGVPEVPVDLVASPGAFVVVEWDGEAVGVTGPRQVRVSGEEGWVRGTMPSRPRAGSYRLGPLRPGPATLEVTWREASSGAERTESRAIELVAGVTETVTVAPLPEPALPASRPVTGRAVARGLGQADRVVQAVLDGELLAFTWTRADGTFSLDVPGHGTAELVLGGPHERASSEPGALAPRRPVPPGAGALDLGAIEVPTGSIAGFVPGGRAGARARIEVLALDHPGLDPMEPRIDRDGAFHAGPLPDGAYGIRVRRWVDDAWMTVAEHRVELDGGGSAWVDVAP